MVNFNLHAMEIANQKYVVTGGAGFIGSSLVRALIRAGAGRVLVIDNLATGHLRNLKEVWDCIEFHQVDIRDYSLTAPLIAGSDVVFHQAAIPSVPRSIDEPVLSHDVNVNGTFNVFLAAANGGVRRVLYAASSSVYGDSDVLPKVESMLPRPKSPYALQKLIGEQYAAIFESTFRLETVCLRYFNVYGPRQDPTSTYSGVLSIFIKSILNRCAPTIYGDGSTSRDFTYVEDVVSLNLAAAFAAKLPGRLYNCGCGGQITLNTAWNTLLELEHLNMRPVYGTPRKGDVAQSCADIAAARRDLGFEPKYPFIKGLAETLDWYRPQREPISGASLGA